MDNTRHCDALVIDDDPLVTKVLEAMFRQIGASVVVANRPFGVVELVQKYRPLLVVLDVKMSGLDGTTLTKLIRREQHLTKTVILLHSALDEDLLSKFAAQCKADGYIPKARGIPFLKESIEKWLQEAAARSAKSV